MPERPADPSAPAATTRALAALLTRPGHDTLGTVSPDLLAAAEAHGVLPLLAATLQDAGLLGALPAATRDGLQRARREAIVVDAVAGDHARRVTAALGAAGVGALVFKGAAIGVTHYAASWHRPRGDVDLLVPEDQRAQAGAVLEGLGCRLVPRPVGRFVTYQARYIGASARRDVTYDLHWRVADPQAFAEVFDYEALAAASVPGPFPHERFLGPVHAMLVACVHRAAHHHDSDRLLLLCDVDRLARRFSADEWARVAHEAERTGTRAVCGRALALSAELLDTPVPGGIRARLASEPRGDGARAPREPTARYVEGSLRRVDILRSDLQRLPGWRARAALLREHLFPPRPFLASQYGTSRSWLVPVLYVDRILRGAAGWFRPVR